MGHCARFARTRHHEVERSTPLREGATTVNDLNAYDYAASLIAPGGRAVDIGCGTGAFTRRLVDLGCTVVALDVVDDAFAQLADLGVTTHLCDVETGALEKLLDGERFDVVVLLDVLEHLRDPEGVLRRCAEFLAPGGVVVLSVPNVSHADVRLSLLAGRFRYTGSGLLDRGHLRFFDREEVERLIKSAALEVVDEFTVVRAPGVTEIDLPDGLPAAALEFVAEDPTSQVYQWIFRLAPSSDGALGDPPFLPLMRRAVETLSALDAATTYARSLEGALADLEQQFHDADRTTVALHEEVANLERRRAELDARDGELADAAERIAGLETELLARADVLQSFREEADAYRRELDAVHAVAAAYGATLAALEPQVAATAEALDAVQGRVGYQAMDAISERWKKVPPLFALGRSIARRIARSRST